MKMDIDETVRNFPLARVELCNWLVLAALAIAGYTMFTPFFAQGVLVGGLLANLSFIILKRDLVGIMAGPLKIAKVSFFIKYYTRLTVLAVIIFILVRHQLVGIFGLLVGLSSVVLSILCTATGLATKIYFTAREVS